MSPDEQAIESLRAGTQGGDVYFTVPRLRTYSIVIVQLK
jgi:hypothetical protein